MSGVVPKRSQEEGVVTHPSSSSSPSSKHPHEDSGSSYPKSTHPPVSTPPPAQAHQTHQLHSIPHPPLAAPAPAYEVESRTVKGSRSEPRDGERRSPLQSVYRSPSLPLPASVSSSDPHLTHTSVLLESRDGTKDVRAESRDNRSEGREIQGPPKGERSGDDSSGKGNTGSYTRNEGRDDVYGEAKREIQGAKSDRDAKSDHHKAETKMEKDVQKDYHRGKRAEGSPQVGVKDSSGPVEGPHLEGRGETVGENKVEDRFKEKEKKRKDLKQREWGDGDKDRNDRRGSVLAGGSVTSETKVVGREEREASRWERERMEQNDRERNKEKEKDHIKREPQSNAEKEVSQNEKELSEASAKPAEQEYVAPEQEDREKDEKESKDKRRERDGDSEAERAEKRSRISEKESEDEGAAAAEREKDALSVQQRKRMLRPRGSPQTTNRDRVCSRSQDKEGVQGKPKVIVVVYKVGECVQELIKLWKEYESSQPDKSGDFATNGPTLEVRIPAEHVTATNRQVRGGQLWGTDIYTDDSDLIAVLMHTGYCRPTASPPPPEMQELRATIRVLPSQEYYTSKLRNNVRSRAWGAGIGCSYRVERCYILKKGGGTIELEPSLTHSSSVEPTLAPMAVERSMTTRAAASNALRQQRFVREVTIQYNLCNEPWIKYSIGIVADKGLKKPMFTSARLKKGEVLYLETHSCRYELCFAGEKSVKAFQASQQHSPQDAMEIDNSNNNSQNHLTHVSNGDKTDSENGIIDVFRWSRCKKPLPQKLMRSMGFPLPPDHVEVLEENLDWEDVEWSQTGVWIAGKEYSLARVHFLAPN